MNPLDFFFNDHTVELLKGRLNWLVDIASRQKRWMLAQVHEGGVNPDPHQARIISEMYEELQDVQKFEGHLEDFVQSRAQRRHMENEVRLLRRRIVRLDEELSRMKRQSKAAKKVAKAPESDAVMAWFAALYPETGQGNGRVVFTQAVGGLPPGAVPISSLYRYRLIVRRGTQEQMAYQVIEVDEEGRRTLSFETDDLGKARIPGYVPPRKTSRISDTSPHVLVGSVPEKGSLYHASSGGRKTLSELLRERALQPFAAPGRYLVSILGHAREGFGTRPDVSGEIVEIVEREQEVLEKSRRASASGAQAVAPTDGS